MKNSSYWHGLFELLDSTVSVQFELFFVIVVFVVSFPFAPGLYPIRFQNKNWFWSTSVAKFVASLLK